MPASEERLRPQTTAKCRDPSLFAPSADTWAAAALRQIGEETTLTPYWPHAISVSAACARAGSACLPTYLHSIHSKSQATRSAVLAGRQSPSSILPPPTRLLLQDIIFQLTPKWVAARTIKAINFSLRTRELAIKAAAAEKEAGAAGGKKEE